MKATSILLGSLAAAAGIVAAQFIIVGGRKAYNLIKGGN